MPKQRVLPYGIEEDEPPRPRKAPPLLITLLVILFSVFAGLGDWRVLNNMLKGLPKAVSLGTIACAVLNYLLEADFPNLKKALSYFPVYMSLIAVYTLVSMYIWVTDFSTMDYVIGGAQKIAYQTITIIYAVCMCYLFETRAVNVLFLCMCITNASIMLLEIPRFGVVQSITSVVTCIITFGNASGFVRAIEIHDITFLFGQFFIYYLMFAPRKTPSEKRMRRLGVGFCIFFMLMGLKRSTLPAMILMCIYVKIVRMTKNPWKLIVFSGVGMFFFSYIYVYLSRSGILLNLLASMGIDVLGRDKLWLLPNAYYEFSPFWKGLGFEGVDQLTRMFHEQGILTRIIPLHNDYLKVFIELGAPGFTLWALIHYVLYPMYWIKCHDTETALLYMAIVCYMSVTYMTDNTAFYFWSSIGLRLIPMSYSYRIYRAKKRRRWKPLSSEEASNLIWSIETGG